MDSVEYAERFEEHLRQLSQMSKAKKREYAKIIESKERLVASRSAGLLNAGDALAKKGCVGRYRIV